VSFDPYQELGVARDADEAAIKRAHRRKAREHHPDKGGDAARFQVVQRAYEVLADPDRRKQFDETGNAEPVQDAENAAMMQLAKLVLEVVDRADLARADLVVVMRDSVEAAIAAQRKQRAQVEQRIARQEEALKRFVHKGGGEDPIALMLTQAVAAARATLPGYDQVIGAYDKLLEVLAAYSYRVDEVQWPGGLQASPFGGIFQHMGGQR